MTLEPSIKRQPLPVDAVVADVIAEIRRGRGVILKASPGTGKTTRVPIAVAGAVSGEVWVLEPRRLAARLSAQRVAAELGEEPGQTVGWQMRFDTRKGPNTRVLFLTEGMFSVLLASNPDLKGVSCVILDEFHERHEQTDIAFTLLRQLQKALRPDLTMIVMSATLDTKELVTALPESAVIEIDAPVFPVDVRHWTTDWQAPLVTRAVAAATSLCEDKSHNGHILIFLPGTAEIIKVSSQLRARLNGDVWSVLELRGSLDARTQNLAFTETGKRKIIVATNIAESSVTIPGVTAVVDSGLARIPFHNMFSGMQSLETRPVSKASVIQRQGRAGRTSAGICLRLFSPTEFAARPDVDIPEIQRFELASTLFSLLALKKKWNAAWDIESLPWLSPPAPKHWDDARDLLRLLGFLDEGGRIKDAEFSRLPLHPRHARFLKELMTESASHEAVYLTAILSQGREIAPLPGDLTHLGCDLAARYESLRSSPDRYADVMRSARQIANIILSAAPRPIAACVPAHDLEISSALLMAFPDRVMTRRSQDRAGHQITFADCMGRELRLSKDSAAAHSEWAVALDASESRAVGAAATNKDASTPVTVVTMASAISKNQLLNQQLPLLTSESSREWDEKAGKPKTVTRVKYGILTLDSKVSEVSEDAGAVTKAMLLRKLRDDWPAPFKDDNYFRNYVRRMELLYQGKVTDHCWQADELREHLIAYMSDECSSFGEIASRPLSEWIRHCVGEEEFTTVERLVPQSIKVGAGHRVEILYPADSPPWIEARLQNFFGQRETPSILNGTLKLTVHLLAPNMRAIQVTTDLSSFWKTVYPAIKNEYSRKYPRHFWPDNPMDAEPPPIKPRRK